MFLDDDCKHHFMDLHNLMLSFDLKLPSGHQPWMAGDSSICEWRFIARKVTELSMVHFPACHGNDDGWYFWGLTPPAVTPVSSECWRRAETSRAVGSTWLSGTETGPP